MHVPGIYEGPALKLLYTSLSFELESFLKVIERGFWPHSFHRFPVPSEDVDRSKGHIEYPRYKCFDTQCLCLAESLFHQHFMQNTSLDMSGTLLSTSFSFQVTVCHIQGLSVGACWLGLFLALGWVEVGSLGEEVVGWASSLLGPEFFFLV